MIVPLINQQVKIINDDHDGTSDFLGICQLFDDTLETVTSSLPEVAALTHFTATDIMREEIPTLEMFLQASTLDRGCQAAAPTVRFSASLFAYECHGGLVRKAPGNPAPQKYVPVSLHSPILHPFLYLTLL